MRSSTRSRGGVLAVTYPWLKRIVHAPQFYLGVAFGWSIPMAFAALTGEVPRIAWLLLTAVVLWAAVYDTMYAMVDREDDRAHRRQVDRDPVRRGRSPHHRA